MKDRGPKINIERKLFNGNGNLDGNSYINLKAENLDRIG